MYSLTIQDAGQSRTLRSAEIQRLVGERKPNHPETMTHLFAIETIEARGIKYANQDFDVLSAAYRFATTEPETVDLCGMPVKLVRQASFTYGPFDVNIMWGGVGMRQGYLVKSSYGVTEELVFVWDSTRPATPVVPQQLADSPFVQDIVAKRIAA